MHLVGDNCLLYPRELEFHSVEIPQTPDGENENFQETFYDIQGNETVPADENGKAKREINDNETVVTEATLDGVAFFTGKFSTNTYVL